ncbi:hypothetical protein EDC04DRAFT_2604796 [Pisolithus marmoratus]|nr:hypothetical protein EDC04DRAFT_2604796 [Pisolithus marmoratus]
MPPTVLWLQCQEAIHYKSTYLTWRRARKSGLLMGKDTVSELAGLCIPGDQGAPPPPNPIKLDWFDVYNQLYIETGPSSITGHGLCLQKIHASPKVTVHGHKAEIPTHFDTAFMLEEDHQHIQVLVLSAVQIAQVHIIFKLPDHLGPYPHPLTYVKWFTALHHHDPVTACAVDTTPMYPPISIDLSVHVLSCSSGLLDVVK